MHKNESKATPPAEAMTGKHLHSYWFLTIRSVHSAQRALNTFRRGEQGWHMQKEGTHTHTHTHTLCTSTCTHSKKLIWVRCWATGGRSTANNSGKRHALFIYGAEIFKQRLHTQNRKRARVLITGPECRIRAKCEEVMGWDKFSGNDRGAFKPRLRSNVSG